MECSEAGRKGGQSRSAKKLAAVRRNIEVARRAQSQNEIRRLVAEAEAHVAEVGPGADPVAERFLRDGKIVLAHLAKPLAEQKRIDDLVEKCRPSFDDYYRPPLLIATPKVEKQ